MSADSQLFACNSCTSRTLCQVCLDDFGRQLGTISAPITVPANIILGEE